MDCTRSMRWRGWRTRSMSGCESMKQSKLASSISDAPRPVRASAAEPLSPGRFLREKVLEPDGITQDQLARALKVSRLTVNEIANERRTVTAEMALRLEAVTRVSALMWLELQRNLDLYRAKTKLAAALPQLRPITRKREVAHPARPPPPAGNASRPQRSARP